MKIKLIGAIFGLLLLSLPAQARLGMTLAECQAKYGQDTLTSNRVYSEVHVFQVKDITVHIVFRNDVAVVVTYHKDGGFEQTEIDGLLDKNANGSQWGDADKRTEPKKEYTIWFSENRGNWTARAEYDTTGPNNGTLIIQTKAEWFEREQQQKDDGI
jgi:hypothetical protein